MRLRKWAYTVRDARTGEVIAQRHSLIEAERAAIGHAIGGREVEIRDRAGRAVATAATGTGRSSAP